MARRRLSSRGHQPDAKNHKAAANHSVLSTLPARTSHPALRRIATASTSGGGASAETYPGFQTDPSRSRYCTRVCQSRRATAATIATETATRGIESSEFVSTRLSSRLPPQSFTQMTDSTLLNECNVIGAQKLRVVK